MSLGESFLVTGGSGGIGAATCAALAAAGYRPVVGYSRNSEAAADIAQRCGGHALHCDLMQADSIDSAIEYLAAAEGTLAGLVHSASPPPELTPFGKTSREEMCRQWQVNVAGLHHLVAGLVRRCFRKNRRGTVIGVLSDAMGQDGGRAMTNMSAYVTAKFGQAGLLATLEAEYSWLKVRAVRPGFTDTHMLHVFDDRFLAGLRDKGHIATAESVAAAILREVVDP